MTPRVPPPPPPPCRRVGGEPFLPAWMHRKPQGVIIDAPGKPKIKTPEALKCTYCGCVHRLADLRTTANCPNCGGNRMVGLETNEPFDLQASLDRRKAYLELMAQAIGIRVLVDKRRDPPLRVTLDKRPHSNWNCTESGGPK